MGVITLVESILAGQACDFVECLWHGEANTSVVLNNWGTEALSFQRDQQVDIIVQSCVVAKSGKRSLILKFGYVRLKVLR